MHKNCNGCDSDDCGGFARLVARRLYGKDNGKAFVQPVPLVHKAEHINLTVAISFCGKQQS